MDRPATLPPDRWERTPPEAHASMRMLEARVETLTTMVHTLQEQVGTLQHSCTSPGSILPALQRVIRPRHSVCGARGVTTVVVVNRAILAIHAPWRLEPKS